MLKFIYSDNSKQPLVIIFECDAENIVEADEKLKMATGKIAVKIPSIGCQVKVISK